MNILRASLFLLLFTLSVRSQIHHWHADGTYADERGIYIGGAPRDMTFAPGVAGKSFNFDGINDRILLTGPPGNPPLPPPWTLSLWVRRDTGPDQSATLLSSQFTAIKLEQWPNTRKVGITQFGLADYTFDYALPVGRWTHLALVAEPGITRLYANGRFVEFMPQAVNLPLTYIGGPPDDRLKGRLDEIKIWDRALTGPEVFDEASVAPLMTTRPRESNPPIPDVGAAFAALSRNGEALAFRMGAGAPLAEGNIFVENSRKAHYQGIQRWERHGSVPYLFVTRAGQDVGRANLLVVRMESRGTGGERMRSNRLTTGYSVNATSPPASDRVVANINLGYLHAGSIQLCGDILAVALEDSTSPGLPQGRVAFYDVSKPDLPVLLPYSLDETAHKIGVVGLTRLYDGHFLLVVTWDKNQRVKFYRSSHTSFFDPGFRFDFHTEIVSSNIPAFPHDSSVVHQSLSLITQQNGTVFMLGAYNTSETSPVLNGADRMMLYEVINGQSSNPGSIFVIPSSPEIHKYCSTFGSASQPVRAATSDVNADFLAGSGTYISPSGELLFYACEHWNDGPGRSVRFVEFRHNKVARPGSPAHYVNANAGGPYRVMEGSTTLLSATRSLPVRVMPWIELFDDDNYEGSSVMIDWNDFFLDDYNDFRTLEWNDRASSLRYYVPPGYTAVLHDADNFAVSPNEPSMSLSFVDWAGEIPNLSDPPWQFDNQGVHETRVTSARFTSPVGSNRVGQPLAFAWQIPPADQSMAVFSSGAASAQPTLQAVDGPGMVTAALTVSQPGPFGTLTDSTEAVIEVVNAPPVITQLKVTPVPETSGQRARLELSFTDAGLKDTHLVQIWWGDNNSDAFDRASGQRSLVVEHHYLDNLPSSPLETDYSIYVLLIDDDQAYASGIRNFHIIWRTNASTIDGDNDGLPDYWEDALLTTRAYKGTDDNDGDGRSNIDEYRAGTNPVDAGDFFELVFDSDAGAGSVLTFQTRAITGSGYGALSRHYRIEFTPDLKAGSWQPLPGYADIVGTGHTLHPVVPAAGRVFVRCLVWLQ